MFESISWKQFFAAVFCLVLLYYVLIGWSVLRSKVQRKLAPRTLPPNEDSLPSSPAKEAEGYADATALKLSIQELLQLATQRHWLKQEFLTGLAARLQVYAHLRDTPFQYAIDNFIVQEAKMQCQLTLSTKEIYPLW